MYKNQVILEGFLGKSPEIRFMPSGDKVANVTLATKEVWKDKAGKPVSSTEWHALVFYAERADWLGQWPWSQRSVHALGRDTNTPRAQSLVLCLALAIGLVLLWAIVFLRARGAALLRIQAAVFGH